MANVRLSDNRGREGLKSVKPTSTPCSTSPNFNATPTSSSKIFLPKKPPLCPWRAATGSFEVTRLKVTQLPMTSLRLSEWSLVDKNGLLYHVQAMARESQLGQIEAEAKGSENLLTYFRGSLNDISFANEDVQLSLVAARSKWTPHPSKRWTTCRTNG